MIALGVQAVIVTGGHGADAIDWLFDGERHVPIPVERYGVEATHGAGCTHAATLCALLARGGRSRGRGPGGGAGRERGGPQRSGGDRRRVRPVDVFGLEGRSNSVSSGSCGSSRRAGLPGRSATTPPSSPEDSS